MSWCWEAGGVRERGVDLVLEAGGGGGDESCVFVFAGGDPCCFWIPPFTPPHLSSSFSFLAVLFTFKSTESTG